MGKSAESAKQSTLEATLVTPLPATITPSPTPESTNIQPDDAGSLSILRRLGKGTIQQAAIYSKDGKYLAVPASTGVDIYDAQSLEMIRTLPTRSGSGLVAFSPDGQLLATNTTSQGTVLLWKTTDGSIVQELAGSAGSYLTDLSFSPDGRLVAAGFGNREEVMVWGVADGKPQYTLKGTNEIFSPDSKRVITTILNSGVRTFVLYDATNGSPINNWPGEQAAFGPDGLFAISHNGVVQVVDLEKDLALPSLEGSMPAFTPDGKMMALYRNGSVILYNVARLSPLMALQGHYGAVEGLRFSPNSHTIVGMTSKEPTACCGTTTDTLSIWRVGDGVLLKSFSSPEASAWFSFSSDGERLAVTNPEEVRFYKVEDGSQVNLIDGYTAGVDGLAFSPDGQMLVTVGGNYLPRLWRVGDGQVERRLDQGSGGGSTPMVIAFSPDGKILAVRGDIYYLVDGKRWNQLENAIAENIHFWASSLAFAPDGGTLVTGFMEGKLAIWNLQNATISARLDGGSGEVTSLSYTQDGNWLAAVYGLPDFRIQIWQMPEGKPVITLKGSFFLQAAFSPDGKTLATLAGKDDLSKAGIVQFWNVADGKPGLSLDSAGVSVMTFSKDGKLLATGSIDGTVCLWQVQDGKLLATLQGQSGQITGLAFSPDGALLASGSEDGTVIFWGKGK